ncbi:MAG: glycosyltransferase [Steroidobacteraceae bacterium]
MAFEERNHDATLRLLQLVTLPDPDVAAITVHALLHLRRGTEARQHLASALAEFCVMPAGLLAYAAAEILHQDGTPAAGWIGLGPALELVGEMRDQEPCTLEVSLHSGAESAPPITLHASVGAFRFKLPPLPPGAALRVTCREMPLLGSGLRVPADFGLDGRAAGTGPTVTGWARMGWLPTRSVELCVEDEDGRRCLTRTRDLPRAGPRWPFTMNLRRAGLLGSRISILAKLPDGRWLPLPDAPLLLKRAVKLPGSSPPALGRWRRQQGDGAGRAFNKQAPPIDVIIPVYRGRHETLACIEAALATAGRARVVVVDDATDDPALAAALDELEAANRITLLRNPRNLGFAASVNRALARNRTHDAVLLNSDALVFGDWLERLRAAAYRGPKIGTVTPFSNSGAIASYRRAQEHPLSAEEAATLHELAAATNAGLSHEIPVGVGFCLYVRRDCLREVGAFDTSVFDKGYGEEADFCLRARQLGWSHQLAADVFVYHAGGRSFGSRRAALLDRSTRLLNLRHSGYDRFIIDFMAQDPLYALRRRLDEQRLLANEKKFVLLVTLALGGGVQRFVDERCREIRAQGFLPLLLRPYKPNDSRRCELWTDAIDAPSLRYEIPSDLAALGTLLRRLRVRHVEIQHFLHIDARVIDMVRALDVAYDVFVHDYAWVCPRITMIDGSGRYCGEPAVSVCNSCVRRNGSNLGGKAISVSQLRERSARWLQQARRVFAPSADTATRFAKYFSTPIAVRPHGAPIAPPAAVPRPKQNPVLRIAVIGAIGEHKGYRVLLNCARDAKRRGLALEFVVIGYTENDRPLLATGKVFITGRYSEGEAVHLLRREDPDVVFLPSVWPETWCFALDEAVALGIPVIAFDLGAVGERLRETDLKVLLPLDMEAGPINDRFLDFAATLRMPDRRSPRHRTVALPLKIAAHIRARGDMSFADAPWAGRVAAGLWIEAFSIKPLAQLEPGDLEYKALTGAGFETPWVSDGRMCGTKGMAVPLLGYAVRLKPGPHSAGYDCEYTGYFKSGVTVGPLRNGAPCQSTATSDPLEGIQVRIFKKPSPMGARKPVKAKPQSQRSRAGSLVATGAPPPRQRPVARR